MVKGSKKIVIVGGGLTGLCAATFLLEQGADVTVYEASSRWGGQINTIRVDGLTVELGAEGFVARSEITPHLCQMIGAEDALIDQTTTRSFLCEANTLSPLADGEAARRLGFQVNKQHRGKGVRSMQGGMQQLIEALTEHLDAHGALLRLGASVERLTVDDGLLIESGGASRRFDAGILALSSRAASSLLHGTIDAALVESLSGAPVMSSLSVSLSYPRDKVGHPLDGSGFILPEGARTHGIRACAFTSNKLTHRAPADQALLRVFFRPDPEELQTLPDEAWICRAHEVVSPPLSITSSWSGAWVSRWADILPVHTPAHRALVAAIDAQLSTTPVRLAGAAFHGAGIDASLLSAQRAADDLLKQG